MMDKLAMILGIFSGILGVAFIGALSLFATYCWVELAYWLFG